MTNHKATSRDSSLVSEGDVIKKSEKTSLTENQDDKENEKADNAGAARREGGVGCRECGEGRMACWREFLLKKKNTWSSMYMWGL